MPRQKNKKATKTPVLIIGLLVVVALAVIVFIVMINRGTIEGTWELVEIRPTQERLESYTAAQREMILREYLERLYLEAMEKQFFDDGTGLRTLHGSGSTYAFTWTAENGELIMIEGGVWRIAMEYDVSITGSRLLLTSQDAGNEIIREFRRIN